MVQMIENKKAKGILIWLVLCFFCLDNFSQSIHWKWSSAAAKMRKKESKYPCRNHRLFSMLSLVCFGLYIAFFSYHRTKTTTIIIIIITTTKAWVHAKEKEALMECTRRSEKEKERDEDIYIYINMFVWLELIDHCSLSVELVEDDFVVGIFDDSSLWSIDVSGTKREFSKRCFVFFQINFYHHHLRHFQLFDDRMCQILHYYVVDYQYVHDYHLDDDD